MRTILATATAIAMTTGLLLATSSEAEATGIIRSKSNVCNNRGAADGSAVKCQPGASDGTVISKSRSNIKNNARQSPNTVNVKQAREYKGQVSLLKRTKGTDSQPPQKHIMTHNFRSGGATDGGVRSPRDLSAGQASGKRQFGGGGMGIGFGR